MGTHVNCKEIGARVRVYRQKAGLTQEKLAEMIDVSFQQIQKYESGMTKLNTDRIQKLADALGISIFAFFEPGTNAPYALTDDEIRLIESFRALSDTSARQGLLSLIELAAKK